MHKCIFFCTFVPKIIVIMALRGKYEQSHVAVKVIQWIGCILVCSMIAAGSMFIFEQPLSVTALKWVQFFQSTAMFLLPPLCMAYLWSQEPMKWLKISEFQSFKFSGIAILLMLVALPAINLLSYWNQQMSLPAFLEPLEQWMKNSEESAKVLTEQFMQATTFGGLIINLLLMAVLPALGEELTFRGVLQRLFTPRLLALSPNTSYRHMVQCNIVFSNPLAVLRLYTSYADGGTVWLCVGMDGQSMGTYPDALYQ